MPAVVHPLDALPVAAESLIVRSFFDALKADVRFAEFKPWRLIELPDPSQIQEFSVYTAVVSPAIVRVVDWPSKRETIRPECVVGFVVPWEQTSEDSRLFGLRLLNLVRVKANEMCAVTNGVLNTVDDAGHAMGLNLTDAVVDVRPLPVLPLIDRGAWWVRSHVTWQTDINPVTGLLIT